MLIKFIPTINSTDNEGTVIRLDESGDGVASAQEVTEGVSYSAFGAAKMAEELQRAFADGRRSAFLEVSHNLNCKLHKGSRHV